MPPRTTASKEATFVTDDKRAQYARLVVFNFGIKEKLISKDKDVNTVSQGDLQKAFKSLVGGTLLAGKEGIIFLQSLTKRGATDPKVAERGLTTAYAQEVRPFLIKGLLSDKFGRRGTMRTGTTSGTSGSKAGTSAAKKSSTKKSTAKKSSSKKSTSKSRSSRKASPAASAGATTPAPEAEATGEDAA